MQIPEGVTFVDTCTSVPDRKWAVQKPLGRDSSGVFKKMGVEQYGA